MTQAPQAGPHAATEVKATVYIVDQDAATRESLRALAGSERWSVEAFAGVDELLGRRAPQDTPAALLLNLSAQALDGLDVQRRVATLDAGLPVIFLCSRCDVPATVRAMKAGAVDVLPGPTSDGALRETLTQAIELSRSTMLQQAQLRALQGRYATLTPRERQVMALVTGGLLNKQVAAELAISEITVKAHRGQAMRKMNARSLASLVDMSLRLRGATALN